MNALRPVSQKSAKKASDSLDCKSTEKARSTSAGLAFLCVKEINVAFGAFPSVDSTRFFRVRVKPPNDTHPMQKLIRCNREKGQ